MYMTAAFITASAAGIVTTIGLALLRKLRATRVPKPDGR